MPAAFARQTRKSAEGRFAFSGVARGKGSVCIHHEGFLARCLIRDNEADADLGEVALEPGATAFPEPEKLGITWSASTGGARVTSLAPGGVGAGVLKPGDLVVAVDGPPLDGLADFELSTLLLGPVGTPMRLEIRRDGGVQRVSLPR